MQRIKENTGEVRRKGEYKELKVTKGWQKN